MTELNIGSDSAHSEFEEVGTSVIEESNYSDGEIIDNDWHFELETMLNEAFVDQGMIKNVCKNRNIPDKFRYPHYFVNSTIVTETLIMFVYLCRNT